MSTNVRVVVANRPRLMRDLVVATIVDQPDIEIVGEVQNEADILKVVGEQRPDFLIVALDRPDERPRICDELLKQHPGLRILALAPESNNSIFLWASLDIHSNSIEVSEEGILGALRGKAQVTGGGL
jgi:DNA-binding NarL/FixJ family response regulator